MKYRILFSVVTVISALTINAQLSHAKIYNHKEFAADSKMTYDGSSKFLFFYEDSVKIFPRFTEKEEKDLQRLKEDVEYINEKRLEYLEEFFPYPFEIAYPSYASVNNDTKGCRYAVVVKYQGATTAGSTPFAGTSLGSSPSYTTGGAPPKFVIMIFDTEAKSKTTLKTVSNWLDFDVLVKVVETKFID